MNGPERHARASSMTCLCRKGREDACRARPAGDVCPILRAGRELRPSGGTRGAPRRSTPGGAVPRPATRVLLPGGSDGLGEPLRAVVGAGEHDGGGLLRERDGGSPAALRGAIDLEHGPGQPPTACDRTFTSEAFVRPLLEVGVRISMDGKERWMDNRFVERLWQSLKYEAVYLEENRRRPPRPAADRVLVRSQSPTPPPGLRRQDAGRGGFSHVGREGRKGREGACRARPTGDVCPVIPRRGVVSAQAGHVAPEALACGWPGRSVVVWYCPPARKTP